MKRFVVIGLVLFLALGGVAAQDSSQSPIREELVSESTGTYSKVDTDYRASGGARIVESGGNETHMLLTIEVPNNNTSAIFIKGLRLGDSRNPDTWITVKDDSVIFPTYETVDQSSWSGDFFSFWVNESGTHNVIITTELRGFQASTEISPGIRVAQNEDSVTVQPASGTNTTRVGFANGDSSDPAPKPMYIWFSAEALPNIDDGARVVGMTNNYESSFANYREPELGTEIVEYNGTVWLRSVMTWDMQQYKAYQQTNAGGGSGGSSVGSLLALIPGGDFGVIVAVGVGILIFVYAISKLHGPQNYQ